MFLFFYTPIYTSIYDKFLNNAMYMKKPLTSWCGTAHSHRRQGLKPNCTNQQALLTFHRSIHLIRRLHIAAVQFQGTSKVFTTSTYRYFSRGCIFSQRVSRGALLSCVCTNVYENFSDEICFGTHLHLKASSYALEMYSLMFIFNLLIFV